MYEMYMNVGCIVWLYVRIYYTFNGNQTFIISTIQVWFIRKSIVSYTQTKYEIFLKTSNNCWFIKFIVLSNFII